MNELTEVGKTISAATAATIRTAITALQELLALAEAEAPETEGDTLVEAITKSEDGKAFPASDYAYVPDTTKPSEWKLRLTATPGGEPDSGIVGAACAALGPGFRGQKVEIPEADMPAVKAKVRAAWRKANPDKEAADMPSGIKESEDADLTGDFVALVETAIRADGTVPIKVIAPGWGTSGYYSPEVLARDGPRVFTAGMHMHLDHPTAQEEAQRPERSVKDLAGTLATGAVWNADGPAGPGLYADANVLKPYQAAIGELAPHIGVSIRATGKAVRGEAEGRKGNIIEAITAGRSIDYVTVPGAGGQILQLFEAARDRYQITTEAEFMDEQEARELTEAKTALEAEVARLREALLLREARDVVVEALAKLDMPEPTRVRLTESLAKSPPIKRDVKETGSQDGYKTFAAEGPFYLDVEAFQAQITEMAKAELLYLAQATNRGQIRGMGASSASTGGDGKAALQESFRGMFRAQGKSPEEAERLAALAAGGR